MTDRKTVLIRYDEIGLKGRNRKYFEKCLLELDVWPFFVLESLWVLRYPNETDRKHHGLGPNIETFYKTSGTSVPHH